MRFLLDTNVLIPLEGSEHELHASLANFVRLATQNGHVLVYHPATEDDFRNDKDAGRLERNLQRIKQYTRLDTRLECPWNTRGTSSNDALDNEILYALHSDAAHVLVTEDRGIHGKAKSRGLLDRVFTIQTAEDWLRRLYEKTAVHLPNIEDVQLYSITRLLPDNFFDSLRQSYAGFDGWFRDKARDGRKAWVVWEGEDVLGAICIYSQQDDLVITKEGMKLAGSALKLCTFKVGPTIRGRKIGELFLKAAFRYATINRMENIFIHGNREGHHFLFGLLQDFGFAPVGTHTAPASTDVVYLKHHPKNPPADSSAAFEYHRRFFPHFRYDSSIKKFVIPIKPSFHEILFPDYTCQQTRLFPSTNPVGNAIKLAYLCHAQTRKMNPGDLVLFYRSGDERAITSIGVVEEYSVETAAEAIARRVRRRTVYTMAEIEDMARRPTKVMLFRLVKHFASPPTQAWLKQRSLLKGVPQSITRISHEAFEEVIAHAG